MSPDFVTYTQSISSEVAIISVRFHKLVELICEISSAEKAVSLFFGVRGLGNIRDSAGRW